MTGEPQDDCLFCKIVAGQIPATVVRETETTVAFQEFALDSELAQLRRPQINFKYTETPSAERTRTGMHVTPLQLRRDGKRSI